MVHLYRAGQPAAIQSSSSPRFQREERPSLIGFGALPLATSLCQVDLLNRHMVAASRASSNRVSCSVIFVSLFKNGNHGFSIGSIQSGASGRTGPRAEREARKEGAPPYPGDVKVLFHPPGPAGALSRGVRLFFWKNFRLTVNNIGSAGQHKPHGTRCFVTSLFR